jgi:hypothetical protein
LAQHAPFPIDRLSSRHHDSGVSTLEQELAQLRYSPRVKFIVVVKQ